jgi:hypothetical protein
MGGCGVRREGNGENQSGKGGLTAIAPMPGSGGCFVSHQAGICGSVLPNGARPVTPAGRRRALSPSASDFARDEIASVLVADGVADKRPYRTTYVNARPRRSGLIRMDRISLGQSPSCPYTRSERQHSPWAGRHRIRARTQTSCARDNLPPLKRFLKNGRRVGGARASAPRLLLIPCRRNPALDFKREVSTHEEYEAGRFCVYSGPRPRSQ